MHLDCSIITSSESWYVLFTTNFWADISSNFDSHEYHSVDDVILQRICMVSSKSDIDIRINISCLLAIQPSNASYGERTSSGSLHTAFIHTSHRKQVKSPTTNTDVIDLDYTVRDQSQASDWVLVLNSTGLWKYAPGTSRSESQSVNVSQKLQLVYVVTYVRSGLPSGSL